MSDTSDTVSSQTTVLAKAPAANSQQSPRQPKALKETLLVLELMRSILPRAQGSHRAWHQEDWQACAGLLRLDTERARITSLSSDLDLLPSMLQKPDAALACIARIEKAFIEAATISILYNDSIAPETASLERVLRRCYGGIARVALTPKAYEPIANALELIGGIDGQAPARR